jgi:hypothetical protein
MEKCCAEVAREKAITDLPVNEISRLLVSVREAQNRRFIEVLA